MFFAFFSVCIVNGHQLKQFLNHQVKSIRSLNLFKSNLTDATNLKMQHISTRIYLLLLLSCLTTLTLYSTVAERIKSETVQYPTSADYQRLIAIYPDTLDCPCTRTSIPHNEFVVELQVTTYHQACLTSTVDNSLNIGSYATFEGSFIDGTDFEKWKFLFLRGLQQLCQIANETTQNSIAMFQLSNMYAYRAIPPSVFSREINLILNRFEETISTAFEQTLDMIRASSQDNALVAMYSANWKFTLTDPRLGENASFQAQPIIHTSLNSNTSCSCAIQKSCSRPSTITISNGTSYESPKGIVFSCFLLESILLSSLACFYSASCINQYRNLKYMVGTVEELMAMGLSIQLNSSSTRFAVDDTIEKMAYQLFIESWTRSISYQKFFDACQPNYCIYSYRYRFDLLEVLATFISVYGGLSSGLRLVTPRLVRIGEKIRTRRRRRIKPSQ